MRTSKAFRQEMKKIARRGGKAKNAKMTPEERSESARRAAMGRWHPEKLKDAAA